VQPNIRQECLRANSPVSSARGLEVESMQSRSGQVGHESMVWAEAQEYGSVRVATGHIETGKAATGKLIAWEHQPSTPAGQSCRMFSHNQPPRD
jgi:hypothetical protein